MGEGVEMAVVNIVNGKTLTDKEHKAYLRQRRKLHKAAGTDVFSTRSVGRRSTKAGWPLHSDALGVWPSQVQEAEAHACKIGVPTSFDPKTGKCILRDRTHRARYLRANGVKDNDGGYRET